MQHHSASRLTYALDETGQLVDVNNVPAGNKCGCFCPACKGPLISRDSTNAPFRTSISYGMRVCNRNNASSSCKRKDT